MKKELLIVIPAYNEEENIERVVRTIVDKYNQFDYIVVNDALEDAVDDFKAIIRAEKCRTDKNK